MAVRQLPSADLLRQLLRYEPETGKLFWRERPVSMFSASTKRSAMSHCQSWNTRFAGKLAFTSSRQGYPCGRIMGIQYKSSRVIWKIITGEEPGEDVDHKDGNPGNDRAHNLRSGSHASNQKNTKLRLDNTTGITGVVRHRSKWVAQIHDGGKAIYLGVFDNIHDAIAARNEAEVKYGYHPTHGRR